MKQKFVKYFLLSLLLIVPVCFIVVLLLARKQLDTATEDMSASYEAAIAEIEEAPDEIEYVDDSPYLFYTEPISKDKLLEVITLSGADSTRCNMLASLFSVQTQGVDLPWLINYNRGYCDTYTMTFDGDERRITANCYADNVVVFHDTLDGIYTYIHDEFLSDISAKLVESMAYLLRENDSWLWNDMESCVVLGMLDETYPTVNYNIYNGSIVLDNGDSVALSNGVLRFLSTGEQTGKLYAMYPNMQTSQVIPATVSSKNWFPSDSFNIVAVIELLAELELDTWEDSLVQAFSVDLPEMLESWTYHLIESEIQFTTIEYDDQYEDGVNENTLFTLDLISGKISMYY